MLSPQRGARLANADLEKGLDARTATAGEYTETSNLQVNREDKSRCKIADRRKVLMESQELLRGGTVNILSAAVLEPCPLRTPPHLETRANINQNNGKRRWNPCSRRTTSAFEGDKKTPKGIFKLGCLYYRKDKDKNGVIL